MHGVLPLVYQRRNAARADPISCSLFTHDSAEEENNRKEPRRGTTSHPPKNIETESVFMMNNVKRETKPRVSAFSY